MRNFRINSEYSEEEQRQAASEWKVELGGRGNAASNQREAVDSGPVVVHLLRRAAVESLRIGASQATGTPQRSLPKTIGDLIESRI